MPIEDRNDAAEVEQRIARIFAAAPRERAAAVQRLPIPKISAAQERPFVELVDRILAAKASDPDADTSEEEAETDRMVYAPYGLTEEEAAAVEGAVMGTSGEPAVCADRVKE